MLINNYPPLPVGGAERQAEQLSAYLAELGLAVGVITRHDGRSARNEIINGVEIIRVPQMGLGPLKSLFFTLGSILTLVKRRNSFDILHAHLAFAPAVVACITGKFLGKRAIVKFGSGGAFGDVQVSKRTLRGRLVLKLLQKWADVCIALNDEIEQEMLTAGFDRSKIVRMVNGVDTKSFSQPDKDEAKDSLNLLAQGKTIILYTGRLAKQKSLSDLLEAVKIILDNGMSNLQLLLVGDGVEREKLIDMSSELRIQDFVTFVGRVEDVKPYLWAADIFVLPSVSEGISNSLLEAMATGLACVATDVSGSSEALDRGECGILVQPNNREELARALTRLISDRSEILRLGSAARKYIFDNYDFPVVVQKYYQLYNRLSAGGK